MQTTRLGGVSRAPYESLNLGAHVGDDPEAVATNRQRLSRALALPQEPRWLTQVHGTQVVDAAICLPDCAADASYTTVPNVVCAVLTADCLPVLLCHRAGTCVAAIHAGWRGLAQGVIEAAVRSLPCHPAELLAWLGPAIGPTAFEVGGEVRDQFIAQDAASAAAFIPRHTDDYLADIYVLARLRLAKLGVTEVYGGGACTVNDAERFYSYRRDSVTGRMTTLIWFT